MSDAPREGEDDRGEIEEAEIDPDEGLDETGDDAGGDEESEGDEEEGQARDVDEPAARRPRANNTIAALRRRAQEAERERDELRRTARPEPQQQRPDPATLAAQENALFERWEQMAPREAERERQEYYRRQFGGEINRVASQLADQMDRQSFEARAATDKSRARLKDKVEATAANLRAQGNYSLTRETIYLHHLGEDVDRRRGEATPRQRREGQRRIAAQTTRPGAARSDAARGRRSAADADEELLRGMTVGDI